MIAKEAAAVLADYAVARRAAAGEAPSDAPEVAPAAPADPPAPPGGASRPTATRRDETALEP